MTEVDPRLVAALTVQLASWREALAHGAGRVGWKLGTGEGERIGSGPVIGHLTSATQLEPGAAYGAGDAVDLHADAEVALRLAADVEPEADLEAARTAIAGYGAALELVDLGSPPPGDPERVVEANVWHRAFALGPLDRPAPAAGAEGGLWVNGEVRASGPIADDYGELVHRLAQVLGAVDERLRAGDRVMTGSVVQIPVEPGDEVTADLGPLGRAHLTIRGQTP